jgi:hypothetical protein
LIFSKIYDIIKYKRNQKSKGDLIMKTVWYLDDDYMRHITVVRDPAELIFLKMRFDYVGVFSEEPIAT